MTTQMTQKNEEPKPKPTNSEPNKSEYKEELKKPFNLIKLSLKIAKTYKLIEYTNNYKEYSAMWNKWKRLLELKDKYK